MKEFFKKKMSVVRFRLETEIPITNADIIEGVDAHKFVEMGGFGGNYGFVSFEDPYGTKHVFGAMRNIFGQYFAGLFRIDKINIPASTLKKEVAVAFNKAKQETGKPFLSRKEKKDITERVKVFLSSKVLPVTKLIPFVVDTTNGEGFFFSTSKSAFDVFEDVFSRAYGASIEIKPIVENGDDFLTYIWGVPEDTFDSNIRVRGEEAQTWIGNKVSTVGEEQKLATSGENVPETALALSRGLDVDKLELSLTIGEKETRFTVNREGAVSGLTYRADDLPDEESCSLLPFITWTVDVFEVLDSWATRYVEAQEQGKGITAKMRATWGLPLEDV